MPDAFGASLGARVAAGLSAVTTALLVLCAGMILWGVVAPSDTEPKPPAYSSLSPAQPLKLTVPSMGIAAPIVPVALSSDAVLDPPNDPVQVGWWDASALPGAQRGQTVITGHTVHTGGGAMDQIGEVKRDRVVNVVTEKGLMRYRVQRTVVLSRAQVAEQAPELFGQDRTGGRLVLITCTDWNGSYYESNVVVFGRPLGQPTGADG